MRRPPKLWASLATPEPGPLEATVDQVRVHDKVSQRLDEIAGLSEHWKRWRNDRGLTPKALGNTLEVLAREVAKLSDIAQNQSTPAAVAESAPN